MNLGKKVKHGVESEPIVAPKFDPPPVREPELVPVPVRRQ